MTVAQLIQKETGISQNLIHNVLALLNAEATVPFIARYRKEATGNLDEVAIYQIQKLQKQWEALEKRKQSILKAIEAQGLLTEEIQHKIVQIYDQDWLEDFYLPYKKKRKTKGETARQNGLEGLAKMIMAQRRDDVLLMAEGFVNEAVDTPEKSLEGARYIIAEWINENTWVRHFLRRLYKSSAQIVSKLIQNKEVDDKAQKYLDYFDWREPLKSCPSHRLLAILRAEKEGIVRLKLEVDTGFIYKKLAGRFIKNNRDTAGQISLAITDAYKRLLAPSIGNETLRFYKEHADLAAIAVFSDNLKQLLLAPPLGEKSVLAIDPGYRTGCKIVCINQQGHLLYHDSIYPNAPQNRQTEAGQKLISLVDKFDIEAIAIGSGTASRETEAFIKKLAFKQNIPVYIVNESGASIYSASDIAREEFPDKDITVRGAVSIGRRLQDPLAELVKIDPKSIGVGQYQHDVDQTLLKEGLDIVVESAVNLVGVNLNTAGKYLLRYVSGISDKLAENIVAYRQINGAFKTRQDLLKVKGLGKKAFEQSAGFLRIKAGDNPLDDSAVHPESYPVVYQMAAELSVDVQNLIGNKKLLQQIDIQKFVTEKTGLSTLKDILKELEKPGLDIRKQVSVFSFDDSLKTIEDIKVGQIYPGLVNNITNFGCFVNLGIKESGLVHISNMSDSFVNNPVDIVKLNQQVRVKVLSVDIDRKRIGLSLLLN